MHDAEPMGRRKPGGDLGGDPQRAGHGQAPRRLQVLSQRGAGQQLHDQEEQSILRLAKIEDGHRVGVGDLTGQLRLPNEALHPGGAM